MIRSIARCPMCGARSGIKRDDCLYECQECALGFDASPARPASTADVFDTHGEVLPPPRALPSLRALYRNGEKL